MQSKALVEEELEDLFESKVPGDERIMIILAELQPSVEESEAEEVQDVRNSIGSPLSVMDLTAYLHRLHPAMKHMKPGESEDSTHSRDSRRGVHDSPERFHGVFARCVLW